MNILILGSGGREHAFAWKIGQSPLVQNLYVAPGNAGTATVAQNVPIQVLDFEGIARFCLENQIDLLIPGGEDALVKGIVDYFGSRADLRQIGVIGPDQEGAQLEGSKDYAKAFMIENHIPTAAYATFNAGQLAEAERFLESQQGPYVLKADGLAAGKGVVILDKLEEAKQEIRAMLVDAKFGAASAKVVVEQFLKGIELSVFVLTDGEHYMLLPSAKDYKRIGEGDTGLNTGGMGAISPVPFATPEFLAKVEERVVKPTISGLKKRNIRYKGFVFIGLMNVGGDPYVIEYNVRMGDPETEAVFPRVQNDFAGLMQAVNNQTLSEHTLETNPHTSAVVILASQGYPESYEKGKVITIPDNGSVVFHCGTAVQNGELVTNGGRVLAVCSLGSSIAEAVQQSMQTAGLIEFSNKYYRKDIGRDLMEGTLA